MGWKDGRDTVYCFDAVTGNEIWQHSYRCGIVDYNGPRATPTVAGGEVYTLSHEGRLHCLDAASGAVLWQKMITSGRPRWGFTGSPLVSDNAIILNAGGAGMAIDRKPPHAVLWESEGIAGYASPLIMTRQSRSVTVLFSQSGLAGIDTETGQDLWWFPESGSFNVPDPVIFKDTIFLSCGYDNPCRLLRVDEDRLSTVWENANLQSECSTAVLVGEYLYGFDDGNRLNCVDIRDGLLAWSNDKLDLHEGSVIAVGERLIVLDDDGKLVVINAAPSGCDTEGRARFTVAADSPGQQWPTPPAFSDGRLYCRSRNGLLVCLRISVRSSGLSRIDDMETKP